MAYRPATPAGLKPKDLIGLPWRVAFALQADGWYLHSDIVWHKPNCQPESVRDRPTRAHEYVFLFAKSETYHYDHEAVRELAAEGGAVLDPFCGAGTVGVVCRRMGRAFVGVELNPDYVALPVARIIPRDTADAPGGAPTPDTTDAISA